MKVRTSMSRMQDGMERATARVVPAAAAVTLASDAIAIITRGAAARSTRMALAILAFLIPCFALTLPAQPAAAAQAKAALTSAYDLATDAGKVRAPHLPIVLFFNRDGCPYCERAL